MRLIVEFKGGGEGTLSFPDVCLFGDISLGNVLQLFPNFCLVRKKSGRFSVTFFPPYRLLDARKASVSLRNFVINWLHL